ncbi:hypothetical protein PR202_ga30989 [Eleusine coracana subsp. coracana]|uniref:Uncharacterized protein n=1 Tax=Eleusine coracana subsp. coracana TaxID=191504 RepID=A0AAV5DRE8_ELECO|nr:hypothetical protein PR202_ga30989 [Eleusine coracana subsp. coracana]
MVKAVVGDEAQIKAFEESLSSSSPEVQVGLVVGKLSASSDRALVYSLLPTPPTDADAPACSLLRAAPKSKTTKGKGSQDASLDFDVDWIAEHARQVSRMLLGGMSVIGIYIWASEASFKATSPAVLSQVIRAVSHACYGSSFGDRLLIHISYSPRRLTVVQAEPFKKIILKAINHLTEEVQTVRALIDGNIFSEDVNISTEGPHGVDFLVPFKNAVPVEDCSLEGVAGLIRFAGSVSALAYLGQKESISEVISDLKDAMERCKEVISLETSVDRSSVLEPESAEVSATLESFWDMVPGAASRAPARSSMVDTQKDGSSRTQRGNLNIVAALLALLIAVIVGFVITFSASWNT